MHHDPRHPVIIIMTTRNTTIIPIIAIITIATTITFFYLEQGIPTNWISSETCMLCGDAGYTLQRS